MTHQTLMRKRVQAMLFAVVLPAAGVFAAPPSDAPGQSFELANLTVRQNVRVDDAAKTAVMNACGELGAAAKSPSINAQIIAGWGGDQYANQTDPKAQNKKYGNHVTVETFDSSKPQGAQLTGRWHVYESGAVYLDRTGKGSNITYACNG